MGPKAIREADYLGFDGYRPHLPTGIDPLDVLNVVDAGDLLLPIGYLERLIIVTLVIYGDFSAIGFLVAAKSLLRFGELSGRKDKTQTEYVLIGTLLSFALGMVIGIGITLVHQWWWINRLTG